MEPLVRRAQAGDAHAFEELYRRSAGRVYALCLRLTGDAVRAEELTQDVFVRCWERLRSFRGDSAFASWLHRLAVNVVLMAARSERRRERRVTPAGDPAELEGSGHVTDPGTRLDLEAAIRRLPPGAREVFVLHDVEGYGHAEIADVAGIATGTSKAQLHRARRLLREMLQR